MVSEGVSQRALWSIGHSNHEMEHFIGLLRLHRVEVLVDVRTSPYSKFSQHFARETLKAVVPHADVRYLFMGKELGGRPTGGEFYDAEGHVLYVELARSALFLEGIERLERGLTEHRCAIMCSEEDPRICHRHLLVARVLRERGIGITYIRGDGRTETFEQAEIDAKALEGRSETLFGMDAKYRRVPCRSAAVLRGR